jgi:glutamyl/glutaminyl-tRNA synthetase
MDLYNEGYLPQAIVNYLALLGWSSADGKEIFSLEELIKNFSPDRINKAPATYDVKKLNWVNSHYMKKLTEEEFCDITIPHLAKKYDIENRMEWAKELVLLFKNSLSHGSDILNNVDMFFNDDLNLDEESIEILKQEEVPNIVNTFKEEINNIEGWNIENISKAIENTKTKTSASGKLLYMPLRIKISGIMHGPELANTIHLIGKEETVKRLSK